MSYPGSLGGCVCDSWQLLLFLLGPAPRKVVAMQGASLSLCVPLQVDQSGLGLPSRDYYLNKTENEKVSLPTLPPASAEGSVSWGLTGSPWWGRVVPHPPTSQSGMAGTRA